MLNNKLKDTARANLKVLTIEDEAQMSNLLRSILISLGIDSIHNVSNAQDAVSMYKKLRPALVFLDIHLGTHSGIDVLGELKALDTDAYVVMVSGVNTFENVKNTLDMGAKGFIAKPFKINKILEAVENRLKAK